LSCPPVGSVRRVPGKELLANVNYRRAHSSISDCNNVFWARVTFSVFHHIGNW
jgi:hypothetical protein